MANGTNGVPMQNGPVQNNGQPARNGTPVQNGAPVQNGVPRQNGQPVRGGYPAQNGQPARGGYPAQNGQPVRNGANGQRPAGTPVKKADVIIQITRDISSKQEEVRNQTKLINSQLDTVMEVNNRSFEEAQSAVAKTDSIYNSVVDTFSSFRKELTYLAMQNETIFLEVTEKLARLSKSIEELQERTEANAVEQREAVSEVAPEPQAVLDYDLLADKVAERLPRAEREEYETHTETVIDYDLLSEKIAARMPAPVQTYTATAAPVAATAAVDYDELSAKVASHIPVQETISTDYIASKVAEQIVIPSSAALELDYDALAKKVAQYVGVNNAAPVAAVAPVGAAGFDYEYLADKVAEKLNVPVAEAPVIDIDEIADRVAERLRGESLVETTSTAEIDLDALADKVAERIPAYEHTSFAAALPSEGVHIDEDEIADRIALKVGTLKAEDFDIIVDDDGCDSISRSITEKLDYDIIAAAISEKLRAALDIATNDEPDYDEMANRIGEKIVIPAVSEDAIADKAAAALSNYLPEIDTDEIADKVVNQVISALPDMKDALAERVADRVIEVIPVRDEEVTEVTETEEEREEVDYDALAERVADKVVVALDERDENKEEETTQIELDYDALAERVAERVVECLPKNEESEESGVTAYSETEEAQPAEQLDYEALADIVANKVCETLGEKPEEETAQTEPDYDALAEKVAAQVIEALPKNDTEVVTAVSETGESATVELDYDALAERVAAQVIEALPKNETEEVTEVSETGESATVELDYDALAEKVAAKVCETLPENSGKSFVGGAVIAGGSDGITEEDIEKVVGGVTEKVAENTAVRFDSIDKDLDDIKALLESGARPASELAPAAAEQTITEDNDYLVTVSDVVSETETSEETYKEDVCSPKTQPSEEDENLDIGGEFSETAGGVDFINMMKYNRSFIARIIQGTDEQKEYYGRIKNALLSYKKVNSNIAWGAERFHKGRETIARLKIRGKTLILYLALDPNEFPVSVYHQKDVSDNKSLHGTPLSVKVMSPLGVKKAIRLIDAMLEKRDGVKRPIPERDYADMYPYETIEELIDDGLVQDVRKP